MRFKKKNLKAQVWVETVIYTLIGLTIIAIILSIAMPKLEETKERGIVTQTIKALNTLHNEIQKVGLTSGNIKIVYFKITKGKLEIKPSLNEIVYTLENTKLKLSEPGIEITEDKLTLLTEEYGKNYNIILKLKLGVNLTFNGNKDNKVIHAASSPYKIQIENIGDNQVREKTHINLNII